MDHDVHSVRLDGSDKTAEGRCAAREGTTSKSIPNCGVRLHAARRPRGGTTRRSGEATEVFSDQVEGVRRRHTQFGEGGAKFQKPVRQNMVWLQGEWDAKHEYSVKHLVRMLVVLVEQSVSNAFDGVDFRTLSRWCPDEHSQSCSHCTVSNYRCHQIWGLAAIRLQRSDVALVGVPSWI